MVIIVISMTQGNEWRLILRSRPNRSFLRSEFVNRAVVGAAAMGGCSVEVAGGVGDHAVVAEAGVRSAGETVRDALRPRAGAVRLGDREGDALSVRAPDGGASVEISGAMENQGAG